MEECCSTKLKKEHDHNHNHEGHDHDHSHETGDKSTFQMFLHEIISFA
jgi:Cd2+/Zn2+-exporting ATPase